ncbi:TPR_REGION domain-containing protein [Rubrivivax sp. A210]|uniref:tetratricopeptide repeat protein n=1 Tax=Rubrivivax sp. A210 TaxID=2772301 RepID=UPI00191B3744|nr:tetratricopeptide repeat protein [Rubrivivax sp. A210]CAD5373156.1 TPR_REGION domain-containing protein [Rubrivivax sp. A210]
MFGWLTKRATKAAPAVAPTPSAAKPIPGSSEAKRVEGNAHLDRNELDAAAACYLEAVRLDERSVPARINLAYVLLELKREQEAQDQLVQVTAVDPSNVDALFMLGGIARARGDLAGAIAHFEKAVSADPGFEPGYPAFCKACVEAGQVGRVEAPLRRGLEALPNSASLHFLLGNALQVAGQGAAALESYQRAIAIRPDHAEAHANAAVVLRSLGQLERAVAHLQRVAAFRAADFGAQMQYGVALLGLDRVDAAIDSLRRAVAISPTSAAGLTNLGIAYAAKGRSDEAIAQYRLALAADKSHAAAYAGLGVELNEQGRPAEAVASLRQAVELDPTAIEAHSSMLFLLSFLGKPTEYIEEARRYGAKVEAGVRPLPRQGLAGEANPPLLRVGLVSGDLRAHPVSEFLEGVLEQLDRGRIELFAYVTNGRQDEMTARLRRQFAGWVSIVGMDDESAARRIQADGIHVLIDLAGHTGSNRLAVFAWRPAPVQVTWLGYLASTGLSSMDYVLADRISLPEASRAQFVEQAWYLPNSLYCFTVPKAAPAVGPSPGLASASVTFGSFQRMNKVSDETLSVWSRVLQAVPGARLRLQNKQLGDPRARPPIAQRLAAFGISAERVIFAGPVPDRAAYLACHDEVDIVLDTFPYPGITTTCEALWMGVPTLTLAGDSLLSSQGASLLHCVGLDDWIAADAEDYVRRAVRHAANREALAQLRAGLRDRARASPLFDAPRFARDLELALHGMWRRAHPTP